VAEDTSAPERRILATGCLFVERKFLRGGGKVGHVEDVVVDAAARRRGLGLRIVRRLVEIARDAGCYKIILDCTLELRAYYAKCGSEPQQDFQSRAAGVSRYKCPNTADSHVHSISVSRVNLAYYSYGLSPPEELH